MCTAAPPGTPGHHHVNCQTNEYWYDKFLSYGYEVDPLEINEVRTRSNMIKPFMQKWGMFFRRKDG